MRYVGTQNDDVRLTTTDARPINRPPAQPQAVWNGRAAGRMTLPDGIQVECELGRTEVSGSGQEKTHCPRAKGVPLSSNA